MTDHFIVGSILTAQATLELEEEVLNDLEEEEQTAEEFREYLQSTKNQDSHK